MSAPHPVSAPHPPYPPPRAPLAGARPRLVAALLLPVFAAFALWVFAWPAARSAPRGLPVGVAGPAAAAETTAEQLRAQDGAFSVRLYPDAATARAAITQRDVYGALVVADQADPAGGGLHVLTASAAGPAVAQLLTRAAAEHSPPGSPVTVRDLVPAPTADVRGTVFGTSVLPLALAGIATGVLVTLARLRRAQALAALTVAAAAVGVTGTLIGHLWLDVLGGAWPAVAGAIALMALAGALTVAGAAALLGPPGIGLGAVIVMMLGNAWSGAGSAPEMLPAPLGDIGQRLPVGAGATLLRSVAFFDGNAAGRPLAVLGAWTLLGATGLLLGPRLRRRRTGPAGQGPGGPIERADPADATPAADPAGRPAEGPAGDAPNGPAMPASA